MAKPKVRNAYDRKRVQVKTEGPSRTKQSEAKSTDINRIMKRYQQTGVLNEVNELRAVYADVSNIGDFREAQEFISQVQQEFLDLPAKIRDRFKNDPGSLIDFLSDDNNREEALQLGLIEPTPELQNAFEPQFPASDAASPSSVSDPTPPSESSKPS